MNTEKQFIHPYVFACLIPPSEQSVIRREINAELRILMPKKFINIDTIVKEIEGIASRIFYIDARLIYSKNRKGLACVARAFCCAMLRKYTSLGIIAVADIYDRDHSTALHAIKTYNETYSFMPMYKTQIKIAEQEFAARYAELCAA